MLVALPNARRAFTRLESLCEGTRLSWIARLFFYRSGWLNNDVNLIWIEEIHTLAFFKFRFRCLDNVGAIAHHLQ
jgi:hypothetical protein